MMNGWWPVQLINVKMSVCLTKLRLSVSIIPGKVRPRINSAQAVTEQPGVLLYSRKCRMSLPHSWFFASISPIQFQGANDQGNTNRRVMSVLQTSRVRRHLPTHLLTYIIGLKTLQFLLSFALAVLSFCPLSLHLWGRPHASGASWVPQDAG